MQIRSKHLIIGLALIIGLGIRTTDAHALYSPRLSQQIGIIRQHVQESQAQNGTQSVLEEIEQIKAYDRAKRANSDETGISGNARAAQDFVLATINVYKPLDTLAMVFNLNYVNQEYISNCLRDEIWSLEVLRDVVGAEMVKAYMLRDTFHGAQLTEDYTYLNTHLDLLRRYGSNPNAIIHAYKLGSPKDVTSNEYFFGEEPKGNPPLNYYSSVGIFDSSDATGCPDGEFEKAINEVVNSWKTLNGTVGGNSLFSAEKWGSIMAMAEANARTRAKKWIRSNQISLTVGGEKGGNPQSLIKGGGWNKFVGSVKTQLNIVKNMVGPVVPFFSWDLYKAPPSTATIVKDIGAEDCKFYLPEDEAFTDCSKSLLEEYEKCQDQNDKEATAEEIKYCSRFRNAQETLSISDKLNKQIAMQQDNEKALKDAENAYVYSLTFDNVSEDMIFFMDDILWDMHSQIERGIGDADKNAGLGIPILTKEIEALSSRQCPNKGR